MTAYEQGLPVHVAYPKPAKMANILGELISNKGLKQSRDIVHQHLAKLVQASVNVFVIFLRDGAHELFPRGPTLRAGGRMHGALADVVLDHSGDAASERQ